MNNKENPLNELLIYLALFQGLNSYSLNLQRVN